MTLGKECNRMQKRIKKKFKNMLKDEMSMQ